jgi:hypothetical protein
LAHRRDGAEPLQRRLHEQTHVVSRKLAPIECLTARELRPLELPE